MRKLLMLEEEVKNDGKLYIYNSGDRCIDVTGDYSIYQYDSTIGINPGAYIYNNDNIYFRAVETTPSPSDALLLMCTKNQIDTTGYKKICATIQCTKTNSTIPNPSIFISIPNEPLKITYKALCEHTQVDTGKVQIELDISDINGLNYIQFGAYQADGYIYNIWLEEKASTEANKLYLYKEGDQCIDVTGGWDNYHQDSHSFWSGGCYKGTHYDSYMSFNIDRIIAMCGLATTNKIDFTGAKKLRIKYSNIKNTRTGISIQFVDSLTYPELTGAIAVVGTADYEDTGTLDNYKTLEIDLSSITFTDKLYVSITIWSETATKQEYFRVKELYIEKNK